MNPTLLNLITESEPYSCDKKVFFFFKVTGPSKAKDLRDYQMPKIAM